MDEFNIAYDQVHESHCARLIGQLIYRINNFQRSFNFDATGCVVEIPNNKAAAKHKASQKDVFVLDDVLQFKRLSEKVTAPKRATSGSVGYDLYSSENIFCSSRRCTKISTDIALQPPKGYYPRVVPRSSLACKFTDIGAGVIDMDYRGHVKVVFFNHSDEDLIVNAGVRIAPFILTGFAVPDIVEVNELDSTERGTGAFGSTGK